MASPIYTVNNTYNGEASDVQDIREIDAMSLRYTEDPQNPGSYIEAIIELRFKQNFVKKIHYTDLNKAQNDFNEMRNIRANFI